MAINRPPRKSTEKKRAYSVAWYWANREKVLEQKKAIKAKMGHDAYNERARKYMKTFLARNPNYDKEMFQTKKLRLMNEFYKAYGDHCSCCGETQKTFLSLEHLNGGGKQHRDSVGAGSLKMLYHLRRRGWPTAEYTVLCMNCNWGKARNGGRCPHSIKALEVISWVANEERKIAYA